MNSLKVKGDISATLQLSETGACFEVRDISLPQVESASHKVVEVNLPLIPGSDNSKAPKNVKLFFDCELVSNSVDTATIRLLIDVSDSESNLCGERQNTPIFIDRKKSRIVVPIEYACSGSFVKIKFYVDRASRVDYLVSGIGIICPAGILTWSGNNWLTRACRIERSWSQRGNLCVLSTTLGDFSAEMPEGWQLSLLSENHLKAAEHFLLSPIEHGLFGVPLYDGVSGFENKANGEVKEVKGTVDLLAFSAGEDSTAAAALLPDTTKKYFCRRQYQHYRTSSGYYVDLQDFSPLESALNNTVNALVIKNDFEKIGLAYGYRHGYCHNFGYAAIGILISRHLNARSISFGSVMEQVFMGSGNNYIDIAKIKTSRANMMKRLLSAIGLDLCFPTGGASEVVTNLIARKSPLGKFVISCASADSEGNPCGTCFKCFRKLRLEGECGYAPSESVIKALSKYPLKSATSLMYAVQKSGYRNPYTDKYLDIDLDFLGRYHGYAIDCFVPEYLRAYIRSSFAYYRVPEMSEGDEKKLRSIGQVFWPEKFDAKRAGLVG